MYGATAITFEKCSQGLANIGMR